jgi:hypothetical protein
LKIKEKGALRNGLIVIFLSLLGDYLPLGYNLHDL